MELHGLNFSEVGSSRNYPTIFLESYLLIWAYKVGKVVEGGKLDFYASEKRS